MYLRSPAITDEDEIRFQFNHRCRGGRLSDHLYMVQKSEKCGFMDRKGKVVIKPAYDLAADHFHEGVAWIGNLHPENGLAGAKYGMIDRDGKLNRNLQHYRRK